MIPELSMKAPFKIMRPHNFYRKSTFVSILNTLPTTVRVSLVKGHQAHQQTSFEPERTISNSLRTVWQQTLTDLRTDSKHLVAIHV